MRASFRDLLVFHFCTFDCTIASLRFILPLTHRARMHCTRVHSLDFIVEYLHSSSSNVHVVHRISIIRISL